MLDITGIKICFMDFDDTICIRTDRERNADYYDCMVKGDWKFFDRHNRAVGRGIAEFVSQCRLNNTKLYVLTWSHSNIMYHAEKGWLDFKFGEGAFHDVIVASSREYKIDVMKHYARTYKIPLHEILFVDDVPEVVDLAYTEGFKVASPQEIALIYG